MYTGIIGGFCEIYSTEEKAGLLELSLRVPNHFAHNAQIGASIAVNGVCLTLTKKLRLDEQHEIFFFDLIRETCEKTNLSVLKPHDLVNLERSLTFGKEVGGHLLTGHVSTKALLKKIEARESTLILSLRIEKKWEDYLIEKTHIGLDGVSLTLVDLEEDGEDHIIFTTHIIPETQRQTTLPYKKEGDELNIEFNQTLKAIVETTKRVLARRERSALKMTHCSEEEAHNSDHVSSLGL